MSNFIHPGFILILTGILVLILPEKIRKPVMIAGPVCTVFAVFALKEGSFMQVRFIPEITLKLLCVDKLAIMFALIFSFASLIGAIYALNSKSKMETGAEAIYAGSSLSVVLAGDWVTMIFFWEIMAIASWLIIVSAKTKPAGKAGFRYLLVHMFGGNMLLAGIILKLVQGSNDIQCLTGTQDAAFWLILIGVAVNAAIPPLHSWIADAYPEAPMGGTVYMASYTTKVGAYCVIRLFAGTEMLLWFGVFMAIFGASMALIENDLRRLFSYHIISQLGYIVAAAAVGGAVGIDGAAAHTFNNILYKGVLFMCCGAVITATGKRKISQLGGLYKQMPLTAVCFLIGSLAITGVPLLNGFVSKSLVMNAMAEGGYHVAEIFLMIASVGTLLSIALKVNYFVFFGKGSDAMKTGSVSSDQVANVTVTNGPESSEPVTNGPESSEPVTNGPESSEPVTNRPVTNEPVTNGPVTNSPRGSVPLNMKVAMVMGCCGCLAIGLMPDLLYGLTPFGTDGHPFTVDHVTQYIELFAAGTLAFVMYLEHMAPKAKQTLDVDWLYRKPLKAAVGALSNGFIMLLTNCGGMFKSLVDVVNAYLHKPGTIVEKMGIGVPKKNPGLEDDDVLQKPAGHLVAVNIVLGMAIIVIAMAVLLS